LEALESVLLYVEQHSKATPTDVIFMKRWRNIAASYRRSTLYQKKITDFVKKEIKCVSLSILSIFVWINKNCSYDYFLHPVRINRNFGLARFGLARLYCISIVWKW
jgi:hypothetical protein